MNYVTNSTLYTTPHQSIIPKETTRLKKLTKLSSSILKKFVNDTGRDWHLQLNPALWAYQTSVRTPTGMKPLSLVYGCEAILPLEVEIPSLRVTLRDVLSSEDYRVAHLE